MQLALRLAVACFVIATPTLLYLGLLRGLKRLRDDALLMRIAENDDVPRDASLAASRAVENHSQEMENRSQAVGKRPVRTDGRGSATESAPASAAASANGRSNAPGRARPPRPESVTCGTCGASNMLGARYCGECLDELNR